MFFRKLIANDLSIPSVVFTLIVTIVLSGIIGFERTLKQKIAGIRTHILIGLGAAVFTLVSRYFFVLYPTSDPSRIPASIISGIGFISVGAIIKMGFTVKGVTTVASVWCVTAIGLTAGTGKYVLASIVTFTVFFTLYFLDKIIKKAVKVKYYHNVKVLGKIDKEFFNKVNFVLEEHQIFVKTMSVLEGKNKIELNYFVEIDKAQNIKKLADSIYQIKGVNEVHIDVD